jgi:hypothetical protein
MSADKKYYVFDRMLPRLCIVNGYTGDPADGLVKKKKNSDKKWIEKELIIPKHFKIITSTRFFSSTFFFLPNNMTKLKTVLLIVNFYVSMYIIIYVGVFNLIFFFGILQCR